MATDLSVDRSDGVALVTLRRPERRNALSIELRRELADVMEALGADEDLGAVVLTGAPPAFCSGMDFTQFGGDRANREAIVESSTRAFGSVARCPLPVLAAVNGPALAGGFALALLCDVRLASETATFGFPELGRGIPPAYAAARAVLPPGPAAELCLTGRVLDAAAARELGVVAEVHPADDLLDVALERARALAARPPWVVREIKRRILLDAERTWWPLLADEEEALRSALLDRPD